jgi:hypothetical protein
MKTHENKTDSGKEFLPPLDLSSIVFPLYTQALVKLGLIEDPLKKARAENLEFARRLIDILDLFRDRTKGNLEEDEEKFLDTCIAQLKMTYVEKTKVDHS